MFKLTIEADTIELLQRKLMAARHAFGITVTSVQVDTPAPVIPNLAPHITQPGGLPVEETKPDAVNEAAKPRKPRTAKAPSVEPTADVPAAESITVEGLQRLCAEVSAIVGMPAVKAMIAGLGVSSVREMTVEQRNTLAGKLRNRHE